MGSSWGFKDWQFCVLEWEADDEEEEDEEEDELRLVSTPVLVIFIFRRFARGALSTLLRKKPSRFPRLNACGIKEISWWKKLVYEFLNIIHKTHFVSNCLFFYEWPIRRVMNIQVAHHLGLNRRKSDINYSHNLIKY